MNSNNEQTNKLTLDILNGLTSQELLEKIRKQLPSEKLKSVQLIDFSSYKPRFENDEVVLDKEDEHQIASEENIPREDLGPIFKPQFTAIEDTQTLDDYFQNFYFNQQEAIHKLINAGRTSIKICEFFKLELDKVRIAIDPTFSFELMPNLIVEEPSGDTQELTCVKINIPFEGDWLNWRYFNLLEIIPKSENIKFISQFRPLPSKTYQAEIVIENEHIEYMITKLRERIFSEENKIHNAYNRFLEQAYLRIEQQCKKADSIQRILFTKFKPAN